jgi:hypothetical protein
MWDGEHEGKCLSHVHIVWAHSIINFVLDVVIIGLPVSTLAKMQLPLGKKIGVCSMFAAGALCVPFVHSRTTNANAWQRNGPEHLSPCHVPRPGNGG